MPNSLLDLAPYMIGLTGAGLALFFLLEMKRQQQEFERRWNKRQMLLQSEMGKLRGTLRDLQVRVEEAERRAELETPLPLPAGGLNLNRRAQAMRLFRRGERPEQVAAALGVPSKDAELLLKVHRIMAVPAAGDYAKR